MEIYDISIAPGQVRDIFVNGSYVYFYSGSAGGADTTITVNQDSRGQRVLLMPGQAYRMPEGQVGTRWLIGNLKGEGTIVGRLVIGSGELTDNRVTGSVEVIDGEQNRTLAGLMFSGSGTQAPFASVYSNTQLWNPAGSGKMLIVKSCNFSSNLQQAIRIGIRATMLTNDVSANRMANKYSGKPLGVAKLMSETTAASINENVLQAYNASANQAITWQMAGPLVISPGYGLTASGGEVNASITLNVEWVEETLQ